MFTPYVLSQLLASMALLVGIFSFFKAKDNHLKLMIGLQALLMAGHFALLGAWVGVALALWGALRYGISIVSRHEGLFWGFLISGTALAVWRFQGPTDALPMVANYASCLAIFLLEGRKLRQTLMVATVCWLGYNAAHASVMGVMVEGFYFIANATALWQSRKKA